MNFVKSFLPGRQGGWLGWIIFLLTPFFFLGGPDYYSPRSVKAVWDLGHVLFFLLLVFFWAPRRKPTRCWPWRGKVILLVLALGGVVELLQATIPGREASLGDLGRDLLGAILAILWLSLSRLQWRRGRGLLVGISLLLLGVALSPLAMAGLDEWRMVADFPLLSGFEGGLERSRWQGDARFWRVKKPVMQGRYALAVALTTRTYSGVNLHYLHHDWQGMRILHLAIFNADSLPLPMVVRVHDRQHDLGDHDYNDRFNRRFSLTPGWNMLDISLAEVRQAPTGREMDMSAIAGVGLFVVRQAEKKMVFLDDVRLIP